MSGAISVDCQDAKLGANCNSLPEPSPSDVSEEDYDVAMNPKLRSKSTQMNIIEDLNHIRNGIDTVNHQPSTGIQGQPREQRATETVNACCNGVIDTTTLLSRNLLATKKTSSCELDVSSIESSVFEEEMFPPGSLHNIDADRLQRPKAKEDTQVEVLSPTVDHPPPSSPMENEPPDTDEFGFTSPSSSEFINVEMTLSDPPISDGTDEIMCKNEDELVSFEHLVPSNNAQTALCNLDSITITAEKMQDLRPSSPLTVQTPRLPSRLEPHGSFKEMPSLTTHVSAGRRCIKLRLLEELPSSPSKSSNSATPLRKFFSREKRRNIGLQAMTPLDESMSPTLPENVISLKRATLLSSESNESVADRGTITVSWYEGTTSAEMQKHVWNCVLRKLNISSNSESSLTKIRLEDVRLLDENVNPHEEVILCPYLPDGASFALKFRTKRENIAYKARPATDFDRHLHPSRAPDSPSAAPSPFPSTADLPSLHAQQLQILGAAAALLQPNGNLQHRPSLFDWNVSSSSSRGGSVLPGIPLLSSVDPLSKDSPGNLGATGDDSRGKATINGKSTSFNSTAVGENPTVGFPTDALIEQQLRQLNELFHLRRFTGASYTSASTSATSETVDDRVRAFQREEKRQVIFVLANYFVLFMSLIALSAEIQSRLPLWMGWVQENYDSVQNCATDRDALFECVSSGDFSGLVASFLLWATQSASAKRIFLFGFDSPKRLWTVVYEALVTAVCWGTSYMFIRRGLNPDTRRNFIHKYWKDAVYGSLAGFNAAFMKAVLKNLVPQDVALEALETRQLKIFHWLGALISHE